MTCFQPVKPAHNTASGARAPIQLTAALASATHVLVRRDGHVPPLAPLYDGPYKVLQRSPHFPPSDGRQAGHSLHQPPHCGTGGPGHAASRTAPAWLPTGPFPAAPSHHQLQEVTAP